MLLLKATVRLKFSKVYDIVSVNGAGVETIQTEDYAQCVKVRLSHVK